MPIQSSSSLFLHLCNRLQAIENQTETPEKITSLSEFLSGISSSEDLLTAIQFIGEGSFPAHTGKRISAGSRTLGLAAAAFCEIDYDLVFKPCRAATGNNSETIVRLLDNIPAARAKREPASLSLADVQKIYSALLPIRSRQDKTDLLHSAWSSMTPLEITYFLRILHKHTPLSGLTNQDILLAIANAFQADPEKVRHTHMLTHSLGETALLAKQNRLDSAVFRLFQPVPFMHAKQKKQPFSATLADYTVEEKLDGIRAQVHADGTHIEIFDRSINTITHLFPELDEQLKNRNFSSTVFDGVICLFKNDRIQPHQLLHKRLHAKKVSDILLSEFPVIFIPFDLLYADQKPLFHETLTDRRQRLSRICEKHNLPVTLHFDASTQNDLNLLFKQALSHGNEGLILKKKNSLYKYGERRESWVKFKKPELTLDTVVMYAHAENRNPGRLYSDFTIGISVEEDNRYEESIIPIGKIDRGYSADDLKNINKQLPHLTAERYGPTLGLKPGIIIRTAFKSIQINKRTKAGYTLRSPRFVEVIQDAQLTDINTLADVEDLYHPQESKDRTPQKENPSFIMRNLPE